MIDTNDATRALAEVDSSRRHAIALRGYAEAGDTLIGWGLTWLAGNLAAQFWPAIAGQVWTVGVVGAALFSMLRGRQQRCADPRIGAAIIIVVGFAAVTMAIVHAGPRESNAIISLLVAAIYAVIGLWLGARLLVFGGILAAAVLVGWFVVPAWFFLCLAIGGGGTLIVGGLWLRRA